MEECGAHNSNVVGSKPTSARLHVFKNTSMTKEIQPIKVGPIVQEAIYATSQTPAPGAHLCAFRETAGTVELKLLCVRTLFILSRIPPYFFVRKKPQNVI